MALSLDDFEAEVVKHPRKERMHLVMKLGPAHYQQFVMLMLERHGVRTVTNCLGVPVVEDAAVDGIVMEFVQ